MSQAISRGLRNSGAGSGRLAGLAWVLALILVLALTGCTTDGGLVRSSADPVTESDESPQRMRARIRIELAVGYFDEGRTPIALDEIKQALAHDPAYAPAYNLRGLVYMRLNEPRQAEESFRRALALDPGDGDTLHNLGWLACQQARYDEAQRVFEQALSRPAYAARARTFMVQGLCHARAGRPGDAERSLARSYELDAANPVTGFNLAQLLVRRGDHARAQFYIRRLNNSDAANAESLWLGIRVEQRLGDRVAVQQLADQLKKRYPQSRELASYDKGTFNE